MAFVAILPKMGLSISSIRSAASLPAASSLPVALSLTGGSTSTAGLGAALASPAASAIGFIVWDKNWTGSAFTLNLCKNLIASVYFLWTLIGTNSVPSLAAEGAAAAAFPHLALSALLGVVVGDCTAIASLQRLGSRRFLLLDCLKPALASAFGVLFLEERITPRLVAGILAIGTGVGVASSVKAPAISSGSEGSPAEEQKKGSSVAMGYALAVIHLVSRAARRMLKFEAHACGM